MQKRSRSLSYLAKWVWYLGNTSEVAANVSGKGTQPNTRESKTLPTKLQVC